MKRWLFWLAAAAIGSGLGALVALALKSVASVHPADLSAVTWLMIVCGSAMVGLGLRIGFTAPAPVPAAKPGASASTSALRTSA